MLLANLFWTPIIVKARCAGARRQPWDEIL